MDMSTFLEKPIIQPMVWLGRRDWITYTDLPHQRAVAARPRTVLFKPKPGKVDEFKAAHKEDPIVVGEKEYEKYEPEHWGLVRRITEDLEFDVIGTLWYYSLSKALAGGPKLFKPTIHQCQALQHSEARYNFDQYKQPYPVIILEIPHEYRAYLKDEFKIENTPKFVLVFHDEKRKFITVSAFYAQDNVITHITPWREEYDTIEDSLVKNRDRRQDSIKYHASTESYAVPPNPEVYGRSESEFDAAENVQRLGINFCMMMSLFSVKEMGPLDPAQFKQWEAESRAKRRGNRPTRRAIEAQQNLAAAMHLLEFDQQVKFYDEEEEMVPVAQGVDIERLRKSPRTHWRRGHFASQPCGVGRRERKIIFRRPTMVRANYFFGDVKDTSVSYEIKPPRTAPEPHTIKTPLETIDPSTIQPTAPPKPAKKEVQAPVQPGQRIELVKMAEDPAPIPIGTQGVVTEVKHLGSGMFQVKVNWDIQRSLMLVIPPDEIKVVQ